MKYLISSIFLILLSISAHTAENWLYIDNLRAIADALNRDKIDNTRGSNLESVEKTPSGFKVVVSGCAIFLDIIPQSNLDKGVLIENPEIRLKIDKGKSICK